MNKNILVALALLSASCGTVNEKTKDAINKGGEVAGQVGTEIIDGISEGIDKAVKREIVVSDSLQMKLEFGNQEVEDKGGDNNQLVLYTVFKQDFNGNLSAKAFNSKGKEIGRTSTMVNYKKGDADHVVFKFPERTYLEAKCRIEIE